MGDFSRSPLDQLIASQNKGYIGVHIEQGVPLLDRDLNLLHDLIAATVRSLFTHYIGSGLAAGVDGFIVQAIPGGNDFRIAAGTAGTGSCLVGGLEVTISSDVLYSAQPGSTPLTTPSCHAARPAHRHRLSRRLARRDRRLDGR